MIAMYDYIITKPELNEDTLAHYGVKGMRWRNRKKGKKGDNGDKLNIKSKRVQERIYNKDRDGNISMRYAGLGKRVNKDFQEHVSDKYSKHRVGNKHKANATSGGTTLSGLMKKRNGRLVRANNY